MRPKLLDLLPGLLDALPHLNRFTAAADRLLTARAGEDSALLASIEHLRADIHRTDASHVAANAALSRRLEDLSTQVGTAAEDAQASRSITVALGHSIVAIERQLRALRVFVITLIVLAGILILMLGWILITRPA